jgi:hypothetical protein
MPVEGFVGVSAALGYEVSLSLYFSLLVLTTDTTPSKSIAEPQYWGLARFVHR